MSDIDQWALNLTLTWPYVESWTHLLQKSHQCSYTFVRHTAWYTSLNRTFATTYQHGQQWWMKLNPKSTLLSQSLLCWEASRTPWIVKQRLQPAQNFWVYSEFLSFFSLYSWTRLEDIFEFAHPQLGWNFFIEKELYTERKAWTRAPLPLLDQLITVFAWTPHRWRSTCPCIETTYDRTWVR